MHNVIRLKTHGNAAEVAKRHVGERFRIKVVQGPDYGSVFVITGRAATIGRSESADVSIADLKSSRLHAEISESASGWVIKDLGSANGIMVNGKALRISPIKTGDTAMIGDTVFEFVEAQAGTGAIVAPVRSMEEIRGQQKLLDMRRGKVQSIGRQKAAPAAAQRSAPGGDQSRQKVLVVLVVGVGIWFFMDGGGGGLIKRADKTAPGAPTQKEIAQAVVDLRGEGGDVNPAAEMFMRAGLREYRERNWLRARQNFENALQIDPTHYLARLYRDHSIKGIDDEVANHLRVGKEALDSGKNKSAKGHFEAVQRLLIRDPVNPAYVEAEEQLQKINLKKTRAGGRP